MSLSRERIDQVSVAFINGVREYVKYKIIVNEIPVEWVPEDIDSIGEIAGAQSFEYLFLSLVEEDPKLMTELLLFLEERYVKLGELDEV